MTGELAFAGLLAVLAITAGWLDLTTRRLPNWLCAVTLLGGLAQPALRPDWAEAGSHLAHAAIALAAGMALFRLSAVGGGDAKFYAGVAAWFPLAKAAMLLALVSLAGLLLLFGWFGYRRAAGKPVRAAGGATFDALPYGLAIGAGAIVLHVAPLVTA